MSQHADYLVVGAGIAAASVGYWLAPHGSVLLLEREEQPGCHATGRSAALFMASYGTAQVRALTMASRAFFEAAPADFGEHPLLGARGAMTVAAHGQEEELRVHWDVLRGMSTTGRLLGAAAACELTPVLRPEMVSGAVYEPDAMDMDVHAIHQGFLRGIRRAGGHIRCRSEVTALRRHAGVWQVQAGGSAYQAPVVINAAGAWCDVVGCLAGARPLGLQPKRRSAFIFAPPSGVDAASWPRFVIAPIPVTTTRRRPEALCMSPPFRCPNLCAPHRRPVRPGAFRASGVRHNPMPDGRWRSQQFIPGRVRGAGGIRPVRRNARNQRPLFA